MLSKAIAILSVINVRPLCFNMLKYINCSRSSTDRIEVCGTSDSSSILLGSTQLAVYERSKYYYELVLSD